MSETEKDMRPIAPDSSLGKALDGFAVPALPAGFADRVVAATEGRAAPLPEPRRNSIRWRSARRLAIGVLAAGALGTAAAATGVLKELGVDLPTPQEVWSTITGRAAPSERAAPAANAAPAPAGPTRVEIEGPIDTPEELDEVFQRVDEVRADRREIRRDRVDQRLDQAIERRRAQGLPAPTPEEEARLRSRIEQYRDRREQQIEQRIEGRREDLRERVESGEVITREDLIGSPRADDTGATRPQRLREMSPEQRREAIQRLRERRQQRLDQPETPPSEASATADEAPSATPE